MKALNEFKKELIQEGAKVSVFDERPYGKKGIIIMIDNNGTKKSIPFKDRKNADKYNRNKEEDILRMLDDAKGLPFGKALDESLTEGAIGRTSFKGKTAKDLEKAIKNPDPLVFAKNTYYTIDMGNMAESPLSKVVYGTDKNGKEHEINVSDIEFIEQ